MLWLHNLWYDFCYTVAWTSLTAGHSFRFEGGRHVPATGPALLLANHESFLDPALVSLSMHRRCCFLARKTLFRNRLFGALIHSLNAVPVDQDGVATEGLKTVLDLLEKEQAVVVFPEGERTHHGAMQPLKPGVFLLVKRAMPPVVPIGVAGAYEAMPRGRGPHFSPLFMPATKASVAVSIGKPLDGRYLATLPREKMLQELFDAIQTQQRHAEVLRRKH